VVGPGGNARPFAAYLRAAADHAFIERHGKLALRHTVLVDPTVLQEVALTAQHRPTGNTRHLRDGMPLSPPANLRIVRFPDDPGFYLLYLDADGNEQTDTCHEDLAAAHRQAEFEFGVLENQWTSVT
jgi:hypothetical protein